MSQVRPLRCLSFVFVDLPVAREQKRRESDSFFISVMIAKEARGANGGFRMRRTRGRPSSIQPHSASEVPAADLLFLSCYRAPVTSFRPPPPPRIHNYLLTHTHHPPAAPSVCSTASLRCKPCQRRLTHNDS